MTVVKKVTLTRIDPLYETTVLGSRASKFSRLRGRVQCSFLFPQYGIDAPSIIDIVTLAVEDGGSDRLDSTRPCFLS